MNSLWSETLGAPRGARFSACGLYRWILWRRFANAKRSCPLVFVMLNPSTADADHDDPTIRRCLRFAQREGADGIVVVNLYAWRATKPRDLSRYADYGADVIGPEADRWIDTATALGPIVVAWGALHGTWQRARADEVVARLPSRPWCLGRTKDGQPRHPLFVRADAPMRRLDEEAPS